MLNKEDIEIDILGKNFVIIKHEPTGITVTKYGKSSIRAMNEALEELEVLIEIWKSC